MEKSKNAKKMSYQERRDAEMRRRVEAEESVEANLVVNPEDLEIRNIKEHMVFVPLFDIHCGGEAFNVGKLRQVLKFIDFLPNARAVLGGDILDMPVLSGATDRHRAPVSPEDAYVLLIEEFTKYLSNTKKIVGGVGGNHDSSSGKRNKDAGFDYSRAFCKHFNIPYNLFNLILKFNLTTEKGNSLPLAIGVTHGCGNASSKAGSVDTTFKRTLNAILNKAIVNMILAGHFHSNVGSEISTKVVVEDKKSGKLLTKNFRVQIESVGSYQEEGMYPASNMMAPSDTVPYGYDMYWVENPLYKASPNTEMEYVLQIDRFPILKKSGEYTDQATGRMKVYGFDKNKLNSEAKKEVKTLDKDTNDIAQDLYDNELVLENI